MNNDGSMITPDVRSWDPFIAMQRLLRWGPLTPEVRAFRPTFEIAEHASGYTIHADVPGLHKEDLRITIEGNQISIAGRSQSTRRHAEVEEHEQFVRTFCLPRDADLEAATAEVDDGNLYLSIPKFEQVKPRKPSLIQRLKNKLVPRGGW